MSYRFPLSTCRFSDKLPLFAASKIMPCFGLTLLALISVSHVHLEVIGQLKLLSEALIPGLIEG